LQKSLAVFFGHLLFEKVYQIAQRLFLCSITLQLIVSSF